MQFIASICIPVAIAALTLASLHDLAVRTVPNGQTTALLGCGLALAIVQNRLPASLEVDSLLLLVGCAFWVRKYLGGADAKLLVACGLLLAPAAVPTMLLTTALAGGLLCVPYLAGPHLIPRPAPTRPARLLPRLLRCEQWRLRRGGPLPYAVAIAAGTIFALLHGA